MDTRLKELLAATISLSVAVFCTAYVSVARVANGDRWWISPLTLIVGVIVGTFPRYAYHRWTKKNIASDTPSA